MTTEHQYPLLDTITAPADLRQLSENQLPQLADEVRQFLIQTVSETGGHLASSLGTVELTVALHYVFNTPQDSLIWDVGHQTYPHKILTGRRDKMSTIRKRGGLSGFLKRSESEYDAFGAGHSSTSISAALGIAIAAQLQNKQKSSVAIIGDGAMTAGMAFEALSHAGDLGTNLLVILNDNEMSISANVGGMSNYLARLLSGKLYTSVRESGKKIFSAMPPVQELARRAEEHVKGMVIPGTLFEELGFNYIGPIEGHDMATLVKTLQNLRNHSGPQFLHIVTKKGKGYQPAEDNPSIYHGVTSFDPSNGKLQASKASTKTYTQIFGEWLCDIAKLEPKMVAITPAMAGGSGMVEFAKKHPDRFFDVGIAEQHSVTLAAGLACEGLKPVVALYSTFMQRAFDQIIHDVAIQNLPVMFAIDRAGIVGPDGATHAGSFDISYLRCIPNLIIMAPSDENECRQMLYTGIMHDGPSAVRYPRANGPGVATENNMTALPIGKGVVIRKGQKVAILAFGSMVQEAMTAANAINATVINMRFVKPLDEAIITMAAAEHELIVTIEENALMGGAGSAVNEYLARSQSLCNIINMGLPDHFSDHATRQEILHELHLDSHGIIHAVEQFHGSQTCQSDHIQLNSY